MVILQKKFHRLRDADYVVIVAPTNVNGKPHRQIYLFEARGIGVI